MLFVCTRIIFIYYGFQKTCVHLALKNSLILFALILLCLFSRIIFEGIWSWLPIDIPYVQPVQPHLQCLTEHLSIMSQLITARFLQEGLGSIYFFAYAKKPDASNQALSFYALDDVLKGWWFKYKLPSVFFNSSYTTHRYVCLLLCQQRKEMGSKVLLSCGSFNRQSSRIHLSFFAAAVAQLTFLLISYLGPLLEMSLWHQQLEQLIERTVSTHSTAAHFCYNKCSYMHGLACE